MKRESVISNVVIEYAGEFDPLPTRKMLGLDGHDQSINLSQAERARLANMLHRYGHLTIRDLTLLGAWRVPAGGGEGSSGGITCYTEDRMQEPTDR